jgi:hypothetical protein
MTVYKIGAARRPTAELESFVGEIGDIFYSMDDTCLRISDGKTPGGTRINIDCFDGLEGLVLGEGAVSRGGLTIEMIQSLEANIAPLISNTYDLGKEGYEWRELYLSGPNIYVGGAVINVNVDGGITLPDNSKIDGTTFYINDQSITYNNTTNNFVFDSSVTVEGNSLTIGGQTLLVEQGTNLVLPEGTKVAGNTFYIGGKEITYDVNLNAFIFDGSINLSQNQELNIGNINLSQQQGLTIGDINLSQEQGLTLGDVNISTQVDVNQNAYLALPSGTRVDGNSFWIGDLEITYNAQADILELPCGTRVCGENFYVGDHQVKVGTDSTQTIVLPSGTTIEGDSFFIGGVEIQYDSVTNELVLPPGTKVLSEDGSTYRSLSTVDVTAEDLQLELYLQDLLNIDISNLQEGSVLQYQGTVWKAKDARALSSATDNDLLLSGGVY